MVPLSGASLWTERWRYTRWGERSLGNNEELYDHVNDPEEFENLVGEGKYSEVLEDMRKKLAETRINAQTGLKNLK